MEPCDDRLSLDSYGCSVGSEREMRVLPVASCNTPSPIIGWKCYTPSLTKGEGNYFSDYLLKYIVKGGV